MVDTSRTSWISHSFEKLVSEYEAAEDTVFDVVIVGSGYGGAIAANALAGMTHDGNEIRLCVLERGNEYLSGAFPAGLSEIPGHVRMDAQKEGLFDFRTSSDVNTLVANGVGGGSLINAGVMERPRAEIFENNWPANLSAAKLNDHFEEAEKILGATINGDPNTILDHGDLPQKYRSLQNMVQGSDAVLRPARITVAMDDDDNEFGVPLSKCIQCGDCATGCNFGAKNSLDLNLLVSAHGKGAEIYSGATVLRVEKVGDDDFWTLHTVHTNDQRRDRHFKHNGTVPIKAHKVILAAGTLGSTEILLRSRSDNLQLSTVLGRRCSTNGDMLVTDYNTDDLVNTVADGSVVPRDRHVGPTITGAIDFEHDGNRFVIEDLSIPAGIRRFFSELFATTNTLHALAERDCDTHDTEFPESDIYALRDSHIENSAVYAVMADDGADGAIELADYEANPGDVGDDEDGIATIRWPGITGETIFDQQVVAVTELTGNTGGRKIPNPIWNTLPEDMQFLVDDRRGPLMTVHPLGGCVMADSIDNGVTDEFGRVYDAHPDSATGIHDGLVVLDGSIIPTALATNPALTISAVALYATEQLVSDWGFEDPPGIPAVPVPREPFRDTANEVESRDSTVVEVVERMAGHARLSPPGWWGADYVIELTMRFNPRRISALTNPTEADPAELELNPAQDESVTASRIRIYPKAEWDDIQLRSDLAAEKEERLDNAAIFIAPIASGTLTVFERQSTWAWGRIWRAFWAYLRNRGFRDTYQTLAAWWNNIDWLNFDFSGDGPGIKARFWNAIALASRGGEIRTLRYNLNIGNPDKNDRNLTISQVSGGKRITYHRKSNMWRQLMELSMVDFPHHAIFASDPTLKLDLEFMARTDLPLVRITSQADSVTAIAELGSFFAYFSRLMLGIHMWQFRKPDRWSGRANVNRLPAPLPDIKRMPDPEIYTIPIGDEVPYGSDTGEEVPVEIVLTRFPPKEDSADPKPLVMIHGYSASGTTFAHNAVRPNLASRFWDEGRDIWILDMRTSSGLPTATDPWSFEQVAYRDIPQAFEEIYWITEQEEMDVLAHCMGAVMFSMAILHANHEVPEQSVAHAQIRANLPGRIRRVALSQVGPLEVFSPANIFRAYIVRYLREFMPDNYTFRPGSEAGLGDQLLDRFLHSLPYPVKEFTRENPWWPCKRTEWVQFRHRMDALYARDFNVLNIDNDVLEYIDDLFGPLSIDTVTQTIHFARYNTITDVRGRNTFVARENFRNLDNANLDNWRFPTLSVHGGDNGLSDVSTLHRMERVLADSGRHFESLIIDGAGHQDCLIGSARHKMADRMWAFFSANNVPGNTAGNINLFALPPWRGPIVSDDETVANYPMIVSIGAHPSMRRPEAAAFLRVGYNNGVMTRADNGDVFAVGDEVYVRDNMRLYISDRLQNEGWDSFPPPAMPTTDGDGLLVLLVYAESRLLAPTATYYVGYEETDSGDWEVTTTVVEGWHAGPSSAPDVSEDKYMLFVRAVLSGLVSQTKPLVSDGRQEIGLAQMDQLVPGDNQPDPNDNDPNDDGVV